MSPIRIKKSDFNLASQILLGAMRGGIGSPDQVEVAEQTCFVWEMGGMFTQEMRDVLTRDHTKPAQ